MSPDYRFVFRRDVRRRRGGWWSLEFADRSICGPRGPLCHLALCGAFSGYEFSERKARKVAARAVKLATAEIAERERQDAIAAAWADLGEVAA